MRREKCIGIDPNEVKKYYDNHTRKETALYFSISEGDLRWFLRKHNLQRSSSGFSNPITQAHKIKSVKEFWNDENNVEKTTKKAQETMENRYGDKQYNFKRAEIALKKKYGVSHYMQADDFKEKSEKSFKEKYGNEFSVSGNLKVPEIQDKLKNTMLSKYGVTNALSSNSKTRDARDKRMVELYGTKIPLQNDKIKEKAISTLDKKYGVQNPGLIHADDIMSKAELELIPFLSKLGFIHNNLTNHPFWIKMSNGKRKYPDFVNYNEKVVLEFNGAYWHQDTNQPIFWNNEWKKLGYKVVIIWDFELKYFIEHVPSSINILLKKYPCTYRIK